MALGDKLGDQTAADLNQYVHSWLDDLNRRIEDLLRTYKLKITIEVERKDGGEGGRT